MFGKQKLYDEINTLNTTIIDLQEKIEQANNIIENSNKKIDELELKIEKEKTSHHETKTVLDEVQEEYTKNLEDLKMLKENRDEIFSQSELLKNEILKYQEEITQLNLKLEEHKNVYSFSNEEVSLLKETIDSLNKIVETIKKEKIEIENKHKKEIEELQLMLRKKDNELNSLYNLNTTKEEELNEANKTISFLKLSMKNLEEESCNNTDYLELEAKYLVVLREYKKLLDKIEELKSVDEENKQLKDKIKELELNRKSIEEENDKLKKEISRLKNISIETSKILRDKSSLNEKIRKLESTSKKAFNEESIFSLIAHDLRKMINKI